MASLRGSTPTGINTQAEARPRPTGDESSSVTDTEADEMEEHLPGLGYLE